MALSGGLHAHLPQKDIEKIVNLTELSQDTHTKFNRTNLIQILWAKCMPIAFELQQVYLTSSLILRAVMANVHIIKKVLI